ncbi:MAG TPA: ABC transporter permease [Thermoplasmata archaeon]|nr:ABC transporter permease [Thermoplasmata archaeon]
MKMWVYLARRALLLVPVVIGVMTITFILVSQVPVQERLLAFLGPSKHGYAPQVPCNQLNPGANSSLLCDNPAYFRGIHELGLDKPAFVQWGIWIYNSFTLNWGNTSTFSQATESLGLGGSNYVVVVLSWYLPYTLELAAVSLLLIIGLSIPIGNYSAVYRNRPFDQGARVVSFAGYSLPTFLLSILLLMAGTFALGGFIPICHNQSTPFEQIYGSWPPPACLPGQPLTLPSWIDTHGATHPTYFPTVDALIHGNVYLAVQSLQRLILPALAIAYGSVAGILRFVRNSMLEVMNLDYIRTAHAKGVPEGQVVRKHAGRNSLNVTVTVLGLTFAGFISGFPIIESVFGLRGIGRALAYSILPPIDLGLIFGSTLLFTFIVVIANLIVDVLYAYLDPRVRLG